MTPDDVWNAIMPNDGPILRCHLAVLSMIPRESFVEALARIEIETSVGPLTNPTAYCDGGRQFDNARAYSRLIRLALELRDAIGGLRERELQPA